MYQDHFITVVVPAYNEEALLPRVLESMPDFVDAIVVIDDGSQDHTAQVATNFQARDPRLTLLRHPVNRGVGAAIANGYIWARDHGSDVAVVMAGDSQMDPVDLPTLLAPVVNHEVDYAKANRLVWLGAAQQIPRTRFIGNAILSLLTKIASGYWHVADSQAGYTAINRRALETIDWGQMYPRYGQPNDLLVRLNVHDFKVRDVPLRPIYNVGERSGIKVRRVTFTISLLLLRMFFWRMKVKYVIRDFHPLVLFYAMGLGFFLLGVVLFARLVVLWLKYGQAPELTALGLVFAMSSCLQSTFFAMWFDMENNKHLR